MMFGFGRKQRVDPLEADRRRREGERYVEALRRLNTVPAWALVTEAGAPSVPLASGLGGAGVGLAGEGWPVDRHGPMRLLARLELAGLDALPEVLAGVGYVVLWEPWDARETVGEADGGDGGASRLLVRAYASRAGLVELEPPASKRRSTFEYEAVSGRWEAIESWPATGDADAMPDLVVPEGFEEGAGGWAVDAGLFDGAPTDLHQVGGWPTLTQGGHWWGVGSRGMHAALDVLREEALPRFALQVCEDEASGVNFGDLGVLAVARGTARGAEGRWFYEIQYT